MFEKTYRIHRHNYEDQFTIYSNSFWEQEYLSWNAKSVLAYMLSRPKDWVIYRAQLASIYKGDKRGNGRVAIDSCFKELISKGYIVYTAKDKKTGKYIHRYDVYPEPFEEFQKKIPKAGKAGMVFHEVGSKGVQQSKESITSNNKELSVAEASVEAPTQKIKIFDSKGKEITIEQSEVFRLAIAKRKKWNTEEIIYAWEALRNYKKKIHDWFAFIEGVIENHRMSVKSKNASTNYRKKSKNASANRRDKIKKQGEEKCQRKFNGEHSVSDTSEHHYQKSQHSLMDAINELRSGSKIQRGS